MTFHVQGLKCDNPNCDWNDTSIQFEDYPEWLNKPCPKCGQVVLTQKDMNTVLAMKAMSESKIVKGYEKIAKLFGAKDVHYRAEMDGTGKLDMHKVDFND